MVFGKYNDYFGRNKSYFNKSYIDYCLKEIECNNNLNEEEISIINGAKLKYNFFISVNLCIFIYTTKQIYTKGLQKLYDKSRIFRFRDSFYFQTGFSIILMFLIYKEAQKTYYNDVKYLTA